jgi:hypothetical protein
MRRQRLLAPPGSCSRTRSGCGSRARSAPARVVEGLDVAEDREPGLIATCPAAAFDQFVLDRGDEAFAGGVVVGSPSRSPASICAWPSQLRNDCGETPSSRASSGSGSPLERTKRTASARNSGGYGGLVLDTSTPSCGPKPQASTCQPNRVNPICIERGRYWQAEYWISGLRDHALSLACRRRSLPARHGRGFDDLPADVRDGFADALVSSFEPDELLRALGSAIAGLLGETSEVGELATKSEPELRALIAGWDH